MKPIYFILYIAILLTSSFVYSQSKGSNVSYSVGHDSLIFEGANTSAFGNAAFDRNCYIKVLNVEGTAKGTVIVQKFISGCGNKIDSQYVAEYRAISKNDILDNSSEVITGSDGTIEIGIFIAGYSKELSVSHQTIHPSSKITLPMIENLCFSFNQNIEPAPYEHVERSKIIQGKVSYKSEKGAKPFLGTLGKNASARHTKTNYSHEVRIDGNDTIDVIRVYEGSVEVTYEKTDVMEEEAFVKEMGKLTEDMLAGKLTAEEYTAKMTEFQSYSDRKTEFSKPVTVDEGNKCTVTKKSRVVEPLGAGDEDR
jgi:hypothetical protein